MLDLPAIIGHRGAAAYAAENSLGGFALAARLGCRMVEFDTRLTADSVPIVFHDDRLDRTTLLSGPVAARSLAELRRGAPQVPTLAEVLELCRSLGLAVNIEIKPDRGAEAATAGAALAVARDLWRATDRPPLMSSFAPRALAVAAALCPAWPRGCTSISVLWPYRLSRPRKWLMLWWPRESGRSGILRPLRWKSRKELFWKMPA